MRTILNWIMVRPPQAPPYVVEDRSRAHMLRLVHVFGIDWLATRWAWVGLLWRAGLCILIGFLGSTSDGVGAKFLVGLGFWGLIELSMVMHQVGAVAPWRT